MGVVRWQCTAIIALVAGLAALNGQEQGSLSGRIVYVSAGHGWTFDNSDNRWYTQRGDFNDIVEDYGNLDQMNFFVAYCFNAGATIVPFRPVGYQTNEVVLDNDDSGVSFVGTWSDSAATSGFYGEPGDLAYRFATVSDSETATAEYTPRLPVTGFYPVYTWVSHGSNRSRQLYRIRHTGGESQVRVPHHMVGSGWIYLGTYYFVAGTNGSVTVSNLREPGSTTGTVVIADAIRFGNGMGDVIPVSTTGGTPAVSGYAREEECARYWVQAGSGVGAPESIYDGSGEDGSDNVGTPPRMAAHMNRQQSGSRYERVFVSFHSNGGGGAARGTIALHNGNHPGEYTTNQFRLAQLIGQEVNNDLAALPSPPLELPWHDRGTAVTLSRSDISFGEINNLAINDEFDATILEVGFHDNVSDAALLRDPKVRQVAGRATYQGLIRYMNEFSNVPLAFLPEPATNVRALGQPNGAIVLQWGAPPAGGGSAQGFVVQVSTNGYGFGPLAGTRGSTSLTLSNLALDRDWFFRVTSTNSAGESLPSEVVACRLSSLTSARVLYVNAFDRFDRFLAPRQTAGPGIAGPNGGSATFDRCQPRRMNSFDYVVQHGVALGRNGVGYDSCQNEAIANNQVRLTNYAAVIWACGQESTAEETFSVTEQSRVAEYLDRRGRLFVSGSEIAWDLDRSTGPTAADRAFLNNYLHATLGNDTNDDAGTYTFSPLPAGVFSGNSNARFDDGSFGIYNVQYPDRLTPTGDAVATLAYIGSGGTAALQHVNSAAGSRLIYFGFPFEAITTTTAREAYMLDVLKFFNVLPTPDIVSVGITQPGAVAISWTAIPGKRYRVQHQPNLGSGTWFQLAGDITATHVVASKTDLIGAGARFYRVMLIEP